jgi:hypothetical protein
VAAFKSLAHDADVASAVKRKVKTAIRLVNQVLDDALALREVLGVDEVSCFISSAVHGKFTHLLRTS